LARGGNAMKRREATASLRSAGILFLATLIVLTGCSSAPSGPGTPAAPVEKTPHDTLVIVTGGEPSTLDPAIAFDAESALYTRATYESLAVFQGDTTKVGPNLATDYSISPDGLSYTLHLRHNVLFSDGTPFNSAAVKFSIQRVEKLNQGAAYIYTASSVTIDTPDDYTVVFHLTAPFAPFLSGLAAMWASLMVSPAAVAQHDLGNGDMGQKWLYDHMVGTGPYILQAWTHGQGATFVRNPHYWKGWSGNHFNKIIIKIVKEPVTQSLLLQGSDADIAMGLGNDQLNQLQSKTPAGVRVLEHPSYNEFYIGLNCQHGPTANPKVRQALSYAFDYSQVVNGIFSGHVRQPHGPLPTTFVGNDPSLPLYHRDLAKAKQLLAEAGYPNGGFTLHYIYPSGYPDEKTVGELFQRNLADLNINFTLQELSGPTWTSTLTNPATATDAFGLWWWPTLADPYDYLWSMYDSAAWGSAGYNFGYYKNDQVDAVLAKAPTILDDQQRLAMYDQAQQILVQDAPMIFAYETAYRLPMRATIQGYVFNGMYFGTYDYYALHKA
jgi:peptide/nickel transport system substrate-binding protein